MPANLGTFEIDDVPAGANEATYEYTTGAESRLRIYRIQNDETPKLLRGPKGTVGIDLSFGNRFLYEKLDDDEWDFELVGFRYPLKVRLSDWLNNLLRSLRRSGVILPMIGFLVGITATSVFWKYLLAPTDDQLKVVYDVAPMIAVLMSMITLLLTLKHNRFSMGVTLLDKLNQEFHGQEMREARSIAGKALQKHDVGVNASVHKILNFFEHVALLERRGAIDRELVWHSFYYWFDHYFRLTQSYRARVRLNDRTQWEDIERLHRRVMEQQRRHWTKAATSEASIAYNKMLDSGQCSFLEEERSVSVKGRRSVQTPVRQAHSARPEPRRR